MPGHGMPKCLQIMDQAAIGYGIFPPLEEGESGKDILRAAPHRPKGEALESVWSCPRDVFSRLAQLWRGENIILS